MSGPRRVPGGAVRSARGALAVLASCALAPLLVACAVPSTAPPAAGRPLAAVPGDVVDVHHGVRVADPYRHFEDLGRSDTKAWLAAQGEHAAATLARIPGRDAMSARLAALDREAGPAVRRIVRMPGDRVWLMRRLPGENQFRLVLRDAATGTDRVVVDPEVVARATGTPHAIDWFVPSWDGRTLAYGLSAGGSEESVMHVVDVASGRPLMAPVPRVWFGYVAWTPDDRTLVFTQSRALPPGAAQGEAFLDATAFAIEPALPAATPRPLFGPLVNRGLGLERLDVPEFLFAPGSRWMVARTTDTTNPEGRLFVAPLAALPQGAAIPWTPIATEADRIVAVALRGDTLYLQTTRAAPRGRVLALRLDEPSPALARAAEAVPEPADGGSLDGLGLGPASVFVGVRRGFATRVVRHGPGAAPGGADVAPGLAGSTRLIDDPAGAYDEPWLVDTTWTAVPTVQAVSGGVARGSGIALGALPAGAPELAVVETLVTSHDGARVPLAVVSRKDLAKRGDHPTLLVGYGAYGFTIGPFLHASHLAWLERGGVLAYVNPRGSGAFGDAWYRAGWKQTKRNTWRDGIAAARWLIDNGYAQPKTLAVMGTSAGGIFVGRAATEAPELFAAAVFSVGQLDAIRSEISANGATNVSEFGSVANAAEFPAMLEMSTYHQIRDGVPYPAVLLVHGLNDPRVDIWHSAKTAARLQAATSSGKPVLLRVDGEAGHGGGSTRSQRQSEQADIYAFLLWQFGLARP